MTDPPASKTPNVRAASAVTLPEGIARAFVLDMIASMSRSYHMLIAPDAPAPKAIQRMAIVCNIALPSPGARYKPTNPVKTTRDITLGFNSDMKSNSGVQTEPAGLDSV